MIALDRNLDQSWTLAWPSTVDYGCYYTTDANHNVASVIQALVGSPVAIVNVDRYVYSAYGEAKLYQEDWTLNASAPYTDGPLYCGYFYDADTGLYLARNRYYDSGLSTWINRDPIGYKGGMNLYEYCGDNPINATDPTGFWGERWFNNDWTDWINPFAYIGATGDSLGNSMGSFYPPEVYKASMLDTQLRMLQKKQLIQQQLNPNFSMTSEDIVYCQQDMFYSGMRDAGQAAQRCMDAIVASAELSSDISMAVSGGTEVLGGIRAARTAAATAAKKATTIAATGSTRNLVKSGLSPLVSDMPELIWNGTRILGTAQETGTPGHVAAIARQVQRMAQSGEYEYITMNRSWKVTTGLKGAAGNLRPDIIGVRRTGVVDAFEVASKWDTVFDLARRLSEGMRTLPAQHQGITRVLPRPAG
jgi:RHS repeat-associated protein